MKTARFWASVLLCFLWGSGAHGAPKVTQAAMVRLPGHDLTALAVEEFEKAPLLVLLEAQKPVTTFTFDPAFGATYEFAYTDSFLRFRRITATGLPPMLFAAAVAPGGSDTNYEIKLVAATKKGSRTINSGPIFLTTQDGIYLGPINHRYGSGMVTWRFQWDAAHYDPHRYEISIYRWNSEEGVLVLARKFTTKTKFIDGPAALRRLHLPSKNFRDLVVRPDEEIGTLGSEEVFLPLLERRRETTP